MRQLRRIPHPSFPNGINGHKVYLELSGWCSECGAYLERTTANEALRNDDGTAHGHPDPWRLGRRKGPMKAITAASLTVAAALFVGSLTAIAASSPQPSLTGTISGTQPACSYQLVATVSGWDANAYPPIGAEIISWSGGTPGSGTRTLVYATAAGDPVPLTSATIWADTMAAPDSAAYRLVLFTLQPSITPIATATLLPDGYSGSCVAAVVPTPTPAPTVSNAPTTVNRAPATQVVTQSPSKSNITTTTQTAPTVKSSTVKQAAAATAAPASVSGSNVAARTQAQPVVRSITNVVNLLSAIAWLVLALSVLAGLAYIRLARRG